MLKDVDIKLLVDLYEKEPNHTIFDKLMHYQSGIDFMIEWLKDHNDGGPFLDKLEQYPHFCLDIIFGLLPLGRPIPEKLIKIVSENANEAKAFIGFLLANGMNVPKTLFKAVTNHPRTAIHVGKEYIKNGEPIPDEILRGMIKPSSNWFYQTDEQIKDIFDIAISFANFERIPAELLVFISRHPKYAYTLKNYYFKKGIDAPPIIKQAAAKWNNQLGVVEEGVMTLERKIYQPILDFYLKTVEAYQASPNKKVTEVSFPSKVFNLDLSETKWEMLQPHVRPIKVSFSYDDSSHGPNGHITLSLKEPVREMIDVIEHEVLHEIQYLLGKHSGGKHRYLGLSKKKHKVMGYDIHGHKTQFEAYYIYANRKLFYGKETKQKPLVIHANNKDHAYEIIKKTFADSVVVTLTNNKKKKLGMTDIVQTDAHNFNLTKPARALKVGDTLQGVKIRKVEKVQPKYNLYYIDTLSSSPKPYDYKNKVLIDFKNPETLRGLKRNLKIKPIYAHRRTKHGLRPVEYQTDLLSALRHLQAAYIMHFDIKDENAQLLWDKEKKKEFFKDVLAKRVKTKYGLIVPNEHENIKGPYLKELYKNFVEKTGNLDVSNDIKKYREIVMRDRMKKIKQAQEESENEGFEINGKTYTEDDFNGRTQKEPHYDFPYEIMGVLDGTNIEFGDEFLVYDLGFKRKYSERDGEENYHIPISYRTFRILGNKIQKIIPTKTSTGRHELESGEDIDPKLLYVFASYNLFKFMLSHVDNRDLSFRHKEDVNAVLKHFSGIDAVEELSGTPLDLNGVKNESVNYFERLYNETE